MCVQILCCIAHNLIDINFNVSDPLLSEFNNMFLNTSSSESGSQLAQAVNINSSHGIEDNSSVTCLSDPFDANNLSENLLIPVSINV